MALTSEEVKRLAGECGFELAGVSAPDPLEDFERFQAWRSEGLAGEMKYLTDHRGDMRSDPRRLLASVQSIVCVGKLYNTPHPHSVELAAGDQTAEDAGKGGQGSAWISRYAWGEDYHDVLRAGLEQLRDRIAEVHGEPFEWKICVDTAPLLERSYARQAGLGWIGKNTCLINQQQGSWFFLGELLLSIPLAPGMPPPDRCGTCRRCIDACPTDALVTGESGTTLDARLCISYLTIEKRGSIPDELAGKITNHVFGCDICQDVCPWNARALHTSEPSFQPGAFAPALQTLAALSEADFRAGFRHSPVWRTKYGGFLRNVAFAIGNTGGRETRTALERLTNHENDDVRAAAIKALSIFDERFSQKPSQDSP
ncbi:MAG TPA: tRNA epoxyqueuosine(34) reductase QueG [Bryobacteraceae bacterium]|nr:tRNA epoxyqueuosine(34) reductase QueG [Bryobacteraceae bacterium]